MKIINYKYWSSSENGWEISMIDLGRINLMVGDSASGKTRFLNTLFNLGRLATGSKKSSDGCWDVKFSHEGNMYNWEIETRRDQEKKPFIYREVLSEESHDKRNVIVERNSDSFKFLGENIPKLKRDSSSIDLLENEELIKPIREGFGNILRRNFSSDELDRAVSYEMITPGLLELDMEEIYHRDNGLNIKLYYLSERDPELYKSICDKYMEVFPFIRRCKIQTLKDYDSRIPTPGLFPIFSIKERYVDNWLPINQLSSGMQKVLLIITDGYFFPDGGICLIDEYENSLGVNAINFFPVYLDELEKDIQFIITSHHPYIINNIPPSSWFIFHRKGNKITVKSGEENIERFGKSKQQRFIQLINDPFFLEGIE
ncbi:MAG: ATP-binding protein [Desulfobacteraceae bacterium]|nr:ATP-binding protein [Desulfobacteraceae bacterium]